MMIKSLQYIIWFGICVGITIMVSYQAVYFAEDTLDANEIITQVVLNPQKMLFNNMLYFTGLIYISYKEYLSPQVALRYKNNTLKIVGRIMAHGAELILIYVTMVCLAVLLTCLLLGIDVSQYNGNPALVILLPVCWYCIYSFSYVLTRKHYIGIILLISSQLIVLLAGVLINATIGFNMFPYVLDYRIALPAAICLCAIAGIVQEKREWL